MHVRRLAQGERRDGLLPPQGGWISPGTLHWNITMRASAGNACGDADAEEEEEEGALLDEVIAACALGPDVARFAGGKAQELGEKGVNLSGGQQARVSLARACFVKDCALALLDDPLAAVDAHVAAWLLEHAILRWLVRKRNAAVVLVTHNETALAAADEVVVLDQGGLIARRGTPATLGFSRATEAPALAALEHAAASPVAPAQVQPSASTPPVEMVPPPPSMPATKAGGQGAKDDAASNAKAASADAKADVPGLFLPEDRELGMVRRATWVNYCRSAGLWRVLAVWLLLVATQGAMVAADYSLAGVVAGEPLTVYGTLCGAAAVGAVLRAVLFFATSLHASTSLHGRALSSVLAAPMWWFHANPLGRILNRFTGDLNNADELLANALFDTCQLSLMVLAAFAALALAVPWLGIALPPLLVSTWRLRQFATKSMRELKRLEGVTKSPLHARLVQAAGSLVAVRAYRQGRSLQAAFESKLDVHAATWWWWLCCNRLFGLLLDMLSSSMVIALAFTATGLKGAISDGTFAFALVYGLTLCGLMQYMLRQSALAESFMTSVERLCYFASKLPKEEEESPTTALVRSTPATAALTTPATACALRGAIVFRDVVVRYRPDLPIVLHGVSATISAGTKVGVVGRTGSGKSSLLLALLRLNHLETGGIALDGVEAATMPLATLRRQVAVIPQTPHLFSGSIRVNLDPSGKQQHSEAALGSAVREARLVSPGASDAEVAALLDSPIEPGGANKSAGECQLIALARALLRDDATVRSPLT